MLSPTILKPAQVDGVRVDGVLDDIGVDVQTGRGGGDA